MKEIILKVEGMHCGGCEARIQNAVTNIKNVQKVTANHIDKTVKIQFENNTTEEQITKSLTEIKELIEDIGFEVNHN